MINYSNWTLQSLFNKVATHLVKQKARSMECGVCVCYDKKTERRCAYGCLLPLKFYRKNGDIHLYLLNDIADINSEQDYFLTKLMKCHDDVKPSKWPGRLRAIAKSHGLQIPECLRINK